MFRTGIVAAAGVMLILAGAAAGQGLEAVPADKPAFKQEELDQMLAPIALYPDDVLSQVLMASTYPMEVVQADRWVKQNKSLKGDDLTKALEAQSWDPSVKSLVNFPDTLAMMSDKLDLTVKLGDAFIGQQKEVLDTIQKLRAKAQDAGNLKTTAEQTVTVDNQGGSNYIVIQPANPEVVYVPTYDSSTVYGSWWYPSYPPAPYYPYGWVAGRALSFGLGVAAGAAWGYAWGNCNWRGGNVNVDVNRNANLNRNINRSNYSAQMQSRNTSFKNGQGNFQHDPGHRQGVAYRDRKTATQYGWTTPADAAKARESFRGRDGTGAQNLGGAGNRPSAGSGDRPGVGAGNRPGVGTGDRPGVGSGNRPSVGTGDRPGVGTGNRPSAGTGNRPTAAQRPASTPNKSAFDGANRSGSSARADSSRGSSSRQASPSRSGGGGARSAGGGGRSGGGGGRGGGGGGGRR